MESQVIIHQQDLQKTVFSVKNQLIEYDHVQLPLLGDYQIQNCITVLNACAVLQKFGLSFTEDKIRQGILSAVWGGRMEVLHENPLVLLDGAHNADGIAKLAQALPHYAAGKEITLILGVLGDKEYPLMLQQIFPLITRAVLTEPISQRKLALLDLQHAVEKYQKPIYLEKEIPQAFTRALSITSKDDMIIGCGSLYMIGALRDFILDYDWRNDL